MDMTWTGVGPCGATLWQFYMVPDSCTSTIVHVCQARYPTMKLPEDGAHVGRNLF